MVNWGFVKVEQELQEVFLEDSRFFSHALRRQA